MVINSVIRTALRTLKRNKMRSALSCLGIIIGISSVILMVGLGNSARIVFKEKLYSFGPNAMSVKVKPRWLDITDVIMLKKSYYQIKHVTPIHAMSNALTKYKGASMYSRLFGVTEDYFKIVDRKIIIGRKFNRDESDSYQKVAIIGFANKEQLFKNTDPISKRLFINNIPFKVIGILESQGEALSGFDMDNQIIIPFSTASTRIWHQPHFNEMYVAAETSEMVPNARELVRSYLRRKYKIPDKQEDGFKINTSEEKLKLTNYILNALSYLLISIALISLVVGGIGIMNIMLASINERTREIGIRMAIGAKKRDIMMQFLIESITLTIIGGLAGIAIGLVIYNAIIYFLKWPFIFSIESILISVLFSGFVGIFFGIIPSKKAANLKPIDALKYE